MKKNIIKYVIISVFSIVVPVTSYSLLATRASAQDFSLGVYPPILQIQATAPAAIRKDFTVVNASDSPQDVLINLKSFASSPANNGEVQYLPDSQLPTPDKEIFQKIQILENDTPVTTLTLAPKQKKTLTIHIGLPKDEPGGDYYFSILFLSRDASGENQNGSHIAAGIATNVLLSIEPKDATSGFIDEFSVPWFVQTGPIPFTVSIANTSRHFITPTGQILIRNMFGQLVGKVDLLPVNILGESTRYIPSVVTSQQSSMGSDKPVALWGEKVLFGPYQATLTIALSEQGPIFIRKIYFFAMPWEYLVGAGIAIVIMWIVIERVRKRVHSS